MPLYDFHCEKCGHRFSKILPLGTKEAKCHLCNATARKLISAPAVHFSGDGFYSNDNRKTNKTSSPKKEEKKEVSEKISPVQTKGAEKNNTGNPDKERKGQKSG